MVSGASEVPDANYVVADECYALPMDTLKFT